MTNTQSESWPLKQITTNNGILYVNCLPFHAKITKDYSTIFFRLCALYLIHFVLNYLDNLVMK